MKRIYWRIYLHSVILLLVVALGIVSVVLLIERLPPRHGAPVRQAELAASALLPSLGDGEKLGETLARCQRSVDLGIAVYSGAGELLATAGPTVPPPLQPEERAALPERSYLHRGARLFVATPLDKGFPEGAYLVMGELTPSGLTRIFGSLAVLFLFIVIASIPLSRNIARPLEELTAVTRDLSRGNLSARARERGDDEIGQLARAVNIMAARLDLKIRREKELLGNISHEIRTPLSRIRVALELCEEESGGTAGMVSRLGGIVADVAELDQMVEDILISTRLDLAADGTGAGAMILRKEPVDLADLIDSAARAFTERHPGHPVRRRPLPERCSLRADPALLRRVFGNLLDNAARHSNTALPIEIAVDCDGEGGEAIFEVRDRGTGIADTDAARIFEPFYRAGRETRADGSGVGLGLSLCKRIVEAHGGEITASSNSGGGAIFRFTLPLNNPVDTVKASPPLPPPC